MELTSLRCEEVVEAELEPAVKVHLSGFVFYSKIANFTNIGTTFIFFNRKLKLVEICL